ncbi:MAG: hypothetical protein ACU0E9_07825 [Limimaricola soesokkakensis]|uniref:hypothetical protein n=1 Tax=Limimaricola soesokkakensis TaxID=1343159 RepID=UPI0040583CBC
MADKNPEPEIARDLFGAPLDQIRDRWGRPSFKKTPENQRDVATLKAAGWSQMRIARFIGCDEKTLRKNFSRELQAGADMIEGQALQVLVAQMRQGKLPAVKRVLDLVEDNRSAGLAPQAPAPEAEPEAPKLGKKEQLALDAAKPTQGWGRLLPDPSRTH